MNEEKVQSPHAALQSMLTRLGMLGPRSNWRPSFRERRQAERLIAVAANVDGRDLALSPIWSLDHSDLVSSDIVGWTVTEDVN